MVNKLEILFQDQWIAVVNKPAGMLSVAYSGSKGKTAQSILEELLRKQGKANGKHKPFAVHRLDRDTSGVMMFALNEQAQKKIMDNWHKMVKERLYCAVAENPFNKKMILPDNGLIDDPLALNAYNIGYVPKSEKDSKGNTIHTIPARTYYSVLKRGRTHTLFQLHLDTGKKNQIRAHLAGKGYPLSGDLDHRGHENPFGRLCLHAQTIEFIHPFTNKNMRFEVPEPEEWSRYVEKGDKDLINKKDNSAKSRNYIKPEKYYNNTERKNKIVSGKELAHMNFIQRGKVH